MEQPTSQSVEGPQQDVEYFSPKDQFEKLLAAQIAKNKDPKLNKIRSKAEYQAIVLEIQEACASKSKTSRQKHLSRKFTIIQLADELRIIRKNKAQQEVRPIFLFFEEIYDKIEREHSSIGHGGRDRTNKACSLFDLIIFFLVFRLILSTVKHMPMDAISGS